MLGRYMAYFPFFVELSGQPGLIAGGGIVALRKVQKLLLYGPRLTVVAPRFVPELASIPSLSLRCRAFAPEDLAGMSFVIAATGDPAINHEISALCQAKRIPVNVVDDKEACSFLFPALVQRGSLSVGISTGGASPTAAIWLKEQINALLPERLDDILTWLDAQRPALKTIYPAESQRATLFARLFTACLDAGGPLTEAQTQQILAQEEAEK